MNVTDWEVLLIRLLSGILQPQSLVTEVMGSSSSQPTTTLSQEQTDHCQQTSKQNHHNKQTSQRKGKIIQGLNPNASRFMAFGAFMPQGYSKLSDFTASRFVIVYCMKGELL